MNFNPVTALYYAACLARPRMVGTPEEQKVAEEIKELLEYFDYEVEERPFTFVNSVNTYISILLGITVCLVGVSLVWQGYAWIANILLLGLFFSFNRILKWAEQNSILGGPLGWPQKLCARLGKQYTTKNLVAKPKTSKVLEAFEVSKPHIYLIAHYDSKSQIMPILVRILLFTFVISGGLIFTVSNLLVFFAPVAFLTPLISMLGFWLFLAALPLIILDVGNQSPGAIDNASSVGTVLHLAECLALNKELRDRIDLTVLIPSAEEMSLMGAAAYVKHQFASLRDTKNLYILNLDGVGVDGRLCYVDASNRHHPSQLLNYLQQAAAELGFKFSHFTLIGALMDHLPFAHIGCDAISLTAVGKASWWVHTPKDSVEQLHPRGFDEAGMVTLRAIEKIARHA